MGESGGSQELPHQLRSGGWDAADSPSPTSSEVGDAADSPSPCSSATLHASRLRSLSEAPNCSFSKTCRLD